MDAARSIYRRSVVEMALLLSVVIQIASGVRLVLRDWKQRRGAAPWIQAISGGYLAFFLLAPVGAVVSRLIALVLSGTFRRVEIPAQYRAVYAR